MKKKTERGNTMTTAETQGNTLVVIDPRVEELLILKYLFGSTGDALISGAIGEGATRTNASDIFNFLQSFDF